jgi:hypothetical protein
MRGGAACRLGSHDLRMGQPVRCDGHRQWRRAPGELKHLSTPRKRKHPRSSGERTGGSLNHDRGKEAAVAVVGLEGETRGGCLPPPRA